MDFSIIYVGSFEVSNRNSYKPCFDQKVMELKLPIIFKCIENWMIMCYELAYVLERDCELLHASFLNCTMENNENTKIKRKYEEIYIEFKGIK